ncbi:MAG: hypothetical protein AAGF13_05010 [Pseudomonadota bacterium]
MTPLSQGRPPRAKREQIAATTVRYFERRLKGEANPELLRLAADLIEHVAYGAAASQGTLKTVELLRHAKELTRRADELETGLESPRRATSYGGAMPEPH